MRIERVLLPYVVPVSAYFGLLDVISRPVRVELRGERVPVSWNIGPASLEQPLSALVTDCGSKIWWTHGVSVISPCTTDSVFFLVDLRVAALINISVARTNRDKTHRETVVLQLIFYGDSHSNTGYARVLS